MTALRQAIERREVPALQTRDTTNGGFFGLNHEDLALVTQADVRQWLRTINHSNAFFFLTNPDHWPDANGKVSAVNDKPLNARERTSLLAIIRALSVMAKLPERGATAAVERQLQELTFESPKEATIRDLLREARELQP